MMGKGEAPGDGRSRRKPGADVLLDRDSRGLENRRADVGTPGDDNLVWAGVKRRLGSFGAAAG